MTNKEKEILEIIRKNPTIEQSEIADLLGVSRSTVAVHISSLQKQGYLMGKGYIVRDDDYIVGIGACNVDVYGKSLIKIRSHYDHPAHINSSIGGVMYNIIANYNALAGNCKLITAYSDDIYGKAIVKHCEDENIDISDSLLVKDQSSGVFMQVMDDHNDMYLAICDMSVLQNIEPEFIVSKKGILLGARAVVIDPSLNDETIEKIIEICEGIVPLYADPISDNFAKKMKKYVKHFEMIKPNRNELAVLAGMDVTDEDSLLAAGRKLIGKGLKKLVVSLGKDGILYMRNELQIRRRFAEEKNVVNASGAGDALMATLIYGDVSGLEVEKTLDLALAAGIAAIRTEDTVNELMSLSLLEEIIKEKKDEL